MTLQKEMKPHDHKAPPENLWKEVGTTANTHCSHPERAYFLCIALILGPVPGAGHAPALLLPERLCVDAGRRVASLPSGDQSIWIKGQQAPPLLWDRMG